jgi:hypothetical protein
MAALNVDNAGDLHVFELFPVLLGMYDHMGLSVWFQNTISLMKKYMSKYLPPMRLWVDFLCNLDTQHH